MPFSLPELIETYPQISSWLKGIQEDADANAGITTTKREVSEPSNGPAIDNPADRAQNCPPTQPVTPLIGPVSAAASLLVSPLPSPLPIITPPPFILIPRAPLTNEDVAEGRIAMMLTKEQIERLADALPVLRDLHGHDKRSQGNGNACLDADTVDDLSDQDHEMDEEDVSPSEDFSVEANLEDNTKESGGDIGTEEKSMNVTICIQEDFRREVVEWILGVSRRHTYESTCVSLTRISFTLFQSNCRALTSANSCHLFLTPSGMPRNFSRDISFVLGKLHLLLRTRGNARRENV